MNLAELSHQPLILRQKFWREDLQLKYQWRSLSEEELQDPTRFLKNSDLDGLLVSPEFSNILLAHSSRLPSDVVEAGLTDALIRADGKIWLRCFFREALRSLIFRHAPNLDTHSVCYVTGLDGWGRACAVVAIQLGFRRLMVISHAEGECDEAIASLQRHFFGLEIKTLPESELTLQPNNGSLLFNTVTSESESGILENLTYLNFLKKEGLVADVAPLFRENSLMEEAAHVGVRRVSGLEIFAIRDHLFLKALAPQELSLSEDEYLARWKNFSASENQT